MADLSSALFTSSGYLRDHEADACHSAGVDFASLPAILRVLLSTDGTVTKTLESYFWEPIKVHSDEQRVVEHCADQARAKHLNKASRLLYRRVHLLGCQSDIEYARAETYVDRSNLSADVDDDLLAGRIGVGEIIRRAGMETYREIRSIGVDEKSGHLWRCYLIYFERQPAMQITEYFPLAVYQHSQC